MQCSDCRFWHQAASQCRRNAPLPVAGDDSKDTRWPTVAAADWCGEFEAKAGQKAA